MADVIGPTFSIGSRSPRLPIGWRDRRHTVNGDALLVADAEGHALTVAKTGSGKSRSCSIPALLNCLGSMVVLDIKGELYPVTHRWRRELGQRVIRLDPWQVCGPDPDSFNPFDLLKLPGLSLEDECVSMAQNIQGQLSFNKDPFWDECSKSILAGLIAFAATEQDEALPCTLRTLRGLLTSFEFESHLARAVDGGAIKSELARAEFSAYLAHADNSTRPSVKSTANSKMRQFATREVYEATTSSSFALEDFIVGEPMTIYLVVPIDKVKSHAALLRLWLDSLLRALTHRTRPPADRTVFLIDEAGTVGHLDSLCNATVFMRAFGVQVWTFWQSVSQIRQHYGDNWRTLVDNAATLQVFGAGNNAVASEFAALLGDVSAQEILSLPPDRALVRCDPRLGVQNVHRVDYLKDALFRGRFDANPFHAQPPADPLPEPLPPNVLPLLGETCDPELRP